MANRIAEVASALFYREGIHAVGVDRIAADAGVTKRTLYNYYATKDELVAAGLRVTSPVRFAEGEGDPKQQIVDVFEELARWVTRPTYRGCPFVNTAVEITEPRHPALAVARDVKERRRAWFRDRLIALRANDPELLAEQLMVVFDGMAASSLIRGTIAVSAALTLAQDLLAGLPSRSDAAPSAVRVVPKNRAIGTRYPLRAG